MENTIYLALSRQMALRQNMDTIANNIANATTSGYRAQNLLFEEYISDPKGKTTDPEAAEEMSFVYNRGQYHSTESGSMSYTENPLDVALAGPGFMGVVTPDGETLYSRAGQFQLDASGILTTPDGSPVASQGGGEIVIPPDSEGVSIDEAGFISNQDGQIGQMMVVEFADLQKLEAVGNNTYRALEAPIPAENTRVKQGQLEGANVQPVVEMTKMIETLRAYQSTQNILQTEHDRMRSSIQKLTQR